LSLKDPVTVQGTIKRSTVDEDGECLMTIPPSRLAEMRERI